MWDLAQSYEQIISEKDKELAELRKQLRTKKSNYKNCLRGLLQEVSEIRLDLQEIKNENTEKMPSKHPQPALEA